MFYRSVVSIKNLLFMCFLFIYLYIPVICGFFTAYLVGIVGWGYIFFYKGKISKNILSLLFLFSVIVIYIMIIGLLNTGYITQASGALLYFVIFSLPGAVFIIDIIEKKDQELSSLIELIAKISFFQSIISLIFFLFDEIRFPILGILGYDITSPEWEDIINVRLFGFASGLTYSMPAVQAIIGFVILIYVKKRPEKSKLLWYVPFIWFSGVINARTAFVLIIIGLLFLFIKLGRRLFKYILIFVFLMITLFAFLYILNVKTAAWIFDGVIEIFGFLTGGDSGVTFTILRSERFTALPQSIDLFFGTGQSGTSDIGFVRYIWMAGFFGSFFVYILYCKFIDDVRKCINNYYSNSFSLQITFVIMIFFILLNIKGEICGINEVSNLLLLFVVFYHVEKNRSKYML